VVERFLWGCIPAKGCPPVNGLPQAVFFKIGCRSYDAPSPRLRRHPLACCKALQGGRRTQAELPRVSARQPGELQAPMRIGGVV